MDGKGVRPLGEMSLRAVCRIEGRDGCKLRDVPKHDVYSNDCCDWTRISNSGGLIIFTPLLIVLISQIPMLSHWSVRLLELQQITTCQQCVRFT